MERLRKALLKMRSFSALQRAENSSIETERLLIALVSSFSALQRAENSSISRKRGYNRCETTVSVLFSEPKIPQWDGRMPVVSVPKSFSALQRAENSSIAFRNALSGIRNVSFSALQRAENSSIATRQTGVPITRPVSVLFSEPKIPQYRHRRQPPSANAVSVLFSEPKIPQSANAFSAKSTTFCFSALQRAENSSIEPVTETDAISRRSFSALQRAENSSILSF